ncbi:hypothetical protein MTR_5g095375 [Medicago truncatula]|uniref:Uncharacterized protein n=1 Tax=Medicago truncatula TaxID=3880 RepID=A0A072UFJ4_MEDTR|nr:hypothetical protein MTR_5g095375 [Medicago truncatula]
MGRVKPRFHGYGHGESAGNGWGYEHLSAHRVWGRALKLLPTRVRVRLCLDIFPPPLSVRDSWLPEKQC